MTAGHRLAEQSPEDRPTHSHPLGDAGRALTSGMDYQQQQLLQQQCRVGPSTSARSSYTIDETLKIYVNWANYYLLKANCGTRIQNLETDLCDGVVLSQIIESVMNKAVKGICKEPADLSQMVSNVENCLHLLADCGVLVDNIVAADICRGHVKSVLSLLFNLSRFKQQQKGHMPVPANDKTPSPPQQQQTPIVQNAPYEPRSNNKRIETASMKTSHLLKDDIEDGKSGECILVQDKSHDSVMTVAKQQHPVTIAAQNGSGSTSTGSGKMATISRTPSGSRRGDNLAIAGSMAGGSGAASTTAGSASAGAVPAASGSRIAVPGYNAGVRNAAQSGVPAAAAATSPVGPAPPSLIPSAASKERRRQTTASEKASDSELGTDRSDAEDGGFRLRSSTRRPTAASPSTSSSSKVAGLRASGGAGGSAIPRCTSSSGESLSRSRTPSRENLAGKRVLPASALSSSQQHVLSTAAAAAAASIGAAGTSQTVRTRDRDAGGATTSSAQSAAGGTARTAQADSHNASHDSLQPAAVGNEASTQSLRRPTASGSAIKKPVSPNRMLGCQQQLGQHTSTSVAGAARPNTLVPPQTAAATSTKGVAVQRPHPAYATTARARPEQPSLSKLYNQMPGIQMYVRGSDIDSGALSDSGVSGLASGQRHALQQKHQSLIPGHQQQPVQHFLQPQQHLQTADAAAGSAGAIAAAAAAAAAQMARTSPDCVPSARQQYNAGVPNDSALGASLSMSPLAGHPKPTQMISPVRQSDLTLNRGSQSKPGHLVQPQQRPQPTTDPSSDRRDVEERSTKPSQQAGTSIAAPGSLPGTSGSSGLRSAGLVAPKVMGTARIATIMSLQSGRERQSTMLPGDSADSAASSTLHRLPSPSSSNDSVICKPPPGPVAASSPTAPDKGALPSEVIARSKETTFDVQGRTETKCGSGFINARETTFDVSTPPPHYDSRPPQPMSKLTSYEFLRKLGPFKTSGFGDCGTALATSRSALPISGITTSGSRLGLMQRSFETQPTGIRLPADCFSDAEEYAAASGYLSDVGRMRRSDCGSSSSSSRRCRDLSGYMSEDGASLYALRMQQRFQEGMLSAKECLRKCPKFLDDGARDDETKAGCEVDCDSDSKSSVSSSDINEALAGLDGTGSDVGEEPLQLAAGDCVMPPRQCSTPAVVKEARRLSSFGGNPCRAAAATRLSRDQAPTSSQPESSRLAATPFTVGDTQTSLRGVNGSGGSGSSSSSSNRHMLGYMSDSGIGRTLQSTSCSTAAVTAAVSSSLTAQAERQRARKLISPKTQQSLAASRLHAAATASTTTTENGGVEQHKYATLGRPPTVLRRPTADFTATVAGASAGGGDVGQPQRDRQQAESIPTATALTTATSVRAPLALAPRGRPYSASEAVATVGPEQPVSHDALGVAFDSSRAAGGMPPTARLQGGPSSCSSGELASHQQATGRADPDGLAEPAASAIQVQIRQARALSITSSKIVAMQRAAQQLQQQQAQQQPHPLQSQQQRSLPQTPEGWRNSGTFCPPSVGASPLGQQGNVPFPTADAPFACSNGRRLRSDAVTTGAERLSSCSNYTSQSEDDPNVHGSSQSLISSGSSMLSSTADDVQSVEVRRLRRELEAARRRVSSLTEQLHSNAYIVQAFEHSLSNMTLRLQHVSSTSEQKDAQLAELRSTIDSLCKMSGLAQADLARAVDAAAAAADRRLSKGSTCSGSSFASGGSVPLARQMSADSTMSLSSVVSSASSVDGSRRQQLRQQPSDGSSVTVASDSASTSAGDGLASDADKARKKKKNWLRSSFSKAFSRKRSSGGSSTLDLDRGSQDHLAGFAREPSLPPVPPSPSLASISHVSDESSDASIVELKKQLREKELKLTDIRLDALTSAHQLEQLREAMNKMKYEMSLLRADNERLQKMMAQQQQGSQLTEDERGGKGSNSFDVFDFSNNNSLHYMPPASPVPRSALGSVGSSRDFMDKECGFGLFGVSESVLDEGKRVTVTVAGTRDGQEPGTLIGSLNVGCRTKWDNLESHVKKLFKHYLCRIDPATNLGLSAESIVSLVVGEVTRTKDGELPELLPYGYLVGSATNIQIHLKGAAQNSVDALAFETCIPKSILHRYVALLLEHRRIVLSGPSGTGKSYLACRLAEHLVHRSKQQPNCPASVYCVSMEPGSAEQQLEQSLGGQPPQQQGRAGDTTDGSSSTQPQYQANVLVIDNLQHALAAGSHADVFANHLNSGLHQWSYIIGTLSQASTVASTQLGQNGFRWILCGHHIEPVKGLVGRYLRRRLVEAETRESGHNNDLSNVIDWLPDVWQHLNKLLAVHAPGDVTLGVQTFFSCPMEPGEAQQWFVNLWNAELVPLVKAAVRRGLQIHGWQAPWKDPTEWLMQTYPWPKQGLDLNLTRISSEDWADCTNTAVTCAPTALLHGPAQELSQRHLTDDIGSDAWLAKTRKAKHDSVGPCSENSKASLDSSVSTVPSIVDAV